MAKQLFAPIPLRAMARDLSGLQMRVLACVAVHDRMSLVNGKGQGCRASNKRMCAMVGCSYARLCTSLTQLVELGFLTRDQVGRNTVYRVVYNAEDILLFGHLSAAAANSRSTTMHEATCCRSEHGSGEIPPKTAAEYIPLNGHKKSDESRGDRSSEGARASARPPDRNRSSDNPSRQMARLERAIRVGEVLDSLDWFDRLIDFTNDDDPLVRVRADRLLQQLERCVEHDLVEAK